MKYFIRKCRDEQKHFLYTHIHTINIYHYEDATRTTSFLSINHINMKVLKSTLVTQRSIQHTWLYCRNWSFLWMSIEWWFPVFAITSHLTLQEFGRSVMRGNVLILVIDWSKQKKRKNTIYTPKKLKQSFDFRYYKMKCHLRE